MKVAEAIAQILKKEGVEFLVCYPRQLLIDPCAELGIRPIICRQERVGVNIADGISRSTNGRKIGVFAMQGGPGIENAFAGVAQAYGDNIPLLILPAGWHTDRNHVPPYFSAPDNYRHVTKWAAQLNHADRTSEMMRRAFSQMRNGKSGPILIEIPNDIMEADLDAIAYAPVKAHRYAPDPADVKLAAEHIVKSKRPVIHAGQGVLFAEATDELVKLAELMQIPVLTTSPGKSAFPENHPLSLGAAVNSAPKALSHFLKASDYVIGIGTSLTRTPWGPKVPADKKIVHLTNDPGDLNKEFPVEAALLGDARLGLEALIAEIGNRTRAGAEGVVAEVRKMKQEWLDEWKPQLTSSEKPINQYRVINDLMKTVKPETTIITHDSGHPREQLAPFWESRTPRGYLGWGKSTQLGHGLGLIMGAKLAHPDKLCINVMGDAAIGMVGMDLETAVRNRIGILTIVFNNGVMAGEKSSMPKSVVTHNTLDLGGNYAKVAEGLGEWSRRIEEPDAFIPTLKEAIEVTQSGAPALIECVAKQNYAVSRY